MRPFLEITLAKDSHISLANIHKLPLFGKEKAPLNERLISFRFEESDGDDIERNRKGRKDIVTFTFLDQVPEIDGFISDQKLIEINDLIFIKYGWILDSDNRQILPDLVEREFKVIKIEPKFNSNTALVTVTAFDRSIDLDKGAVSFLFDQKAALGSLTPFKSILQFIATKAGLELDETSRVITNTSFQIGSQLAVPRESLASYLKFLAEETGSLFFVENRRLFFGARRIPQSSEIAAVLVRGEKSNFDIKEKTDLLTVPIIDINIERKLSPDSLKYTDTVNNNRTAEIKPETIIAEDLDQLLLLLQSGDESAPDVSENDSRDVGATWVKRIKIAQESDSHFASSFPKTQPDKPFSEQQELNTNEQLNAFLKDHQSFSAEEVFSAIRQASPSLRDEALKAIAKQKLTELVMREIMATVKIYGNPLIRHGSLVTVAGNMPKIYKGNWYVQSVEHTIDGSNYYTTLKLMAASPDNPYLKSKFKALEKKLTDQASKKQPKRTPQPTRESK